MEQANAKVLAVLALVLAAALSGCLLFEKAKIPTPSEAPAQVPEVTEEVVEEEIAAESVPSIVSVEINESEGDFPLPFD